MARLIIVFITIIVTCSWSNISYGYMGNMIILVSPQSMEFHVEDPLGNISGYTPTGIMTQIPNISKYYKTSEIMAGDEVLGEYEKFNSLEPVVIPTDIITGKYKFVIYGISTPTNTNIHFQWGENIKWHMQYIGSKFIYPNVVWSYEFDMLAIPTNNGQIVLTKVSNPTDLITDINTSNQLGYLGTPGTYQSLLAKAQDAQAKVAGGQPIPAKNVLNALINDINAQRGKQINTIAADILIEDAQYIINHI